MKRKQTNLCVVRYTSTSCAGTKLQQHLEELARKLDYTLVMEEDLHIIEEYLNAEHDAFLANNKRVQPAPASIHYYEFPEPSWYLYIGGKPISSIHPVDSIEP